MTSKNPVEETYDFCEGTAKVKQKLCTFYTAVVHTLCNSSAHFVQILCTLCAEALHNLCNGPAQKSSIGKKKKR